MRKTTFIATLPIFLFALIVDAQEISPKTMPMRADRGMFEERRDDIAGQRARVMQNVQEARGELDDNIEARRLETADRREEMMDDRKENREEHQNEVQANNAERRSEMQANQEIRREEIKSRIEERKNQIEERRAEMLANKEARRTKLNEERKNRVQGLFNNMFSGFENAANSLDGISERLSAKISDLESGEADVSETLSILETADSLLADTIAEIEVVKNELNEAVEGEITKEYVQELVAGAKESIRDTHEAYRAVISEINSL